MRVRFMILTVFVTAAFLPSVPRVTRAQELAIEEIERILQELQNMDAEGIGGLVVKQLDLTFGRESRATFMFVEALDAINKDSTLSPEQRLRKTFAAFQARVNSLTKEIWGDAKYSITPVPDDAPLKLLTGDRYTHLLTRIEEIEKVLTRDSTVLPEAFS